jgi:hypothetical protein
MNHQEKCLKRALVAMMVSALTLVMRADDPPPTNAETDVVEDTAASESSPRLTFHGYLSQAFGKSDGHQILGISEDGTTDYRTAALQMRYDWRDGDSFVLQLAHERNGKSVTAQGADAELDWAFYRHQFRDGTSVRVGRMPLPFGIYNEIRDVGTALPFYRPPNSFYGEGSYSSETLDGIAVSRTFFTSSPWSLNVEGYYGGWQFLQQDLETEATVDNAVGVQAWLGTPIEGLDIGVGAYQAEASNLVLVGVDGAGQQRIEATQQSLHASLRGDIGRFLLAAEYRNYDLNLATQRTAYAQFGVRLTDRVSAFVRGERGELSFAGAQAPSVELDRDYAVSLNYAVHPDVILKFEAHRYRGYGAEDVQLNIFDQPQIRANYVLISLSTSF